VVAELTPSFDSAGAVIGNSLGIAVFVAALVLLIRRRRSGARVSAWAWALCILSVSYRGIFVPIGPILALATIYSTRPHLRPTNDAAATPL